jgi:hypothetical protein
LQIKKEASFHKENFRKSKIKDKEDRKRKKGGEEEDSDGEETSYTFKQRELEEDIVAKKQKTGKSKESEGGEEGEVKKTKKVRKRERTKQANFRPDADHSFGALSLAANKSLMQKLFGGGGS